MIGDNGHETAIITSDDVAAILGSVGRDRLMDEMIAGLETALATCEEDAAIPTRDGFVVGGARAGLLEWMPVLRDGAAMVKMVSYSPDNPQVGLPTITATISKFDAATGHLIAIADGVVATALRTGAASAVASRVLALPDSATVGLVGCGAQAVTQLHALSRAFPLRRALVHDVAPDAAASFADRVAFLGLDVRVAPLAQVEAEADILVTATSVAEGGGPVIDGSGLRPHVHVNAVGSDLTGKIELPRALLLRSLVCPDHRPQAVREGECQQLEPDQIGPSLPEVVRRAAELAAWRGRTTVFDSTGFALEDQVAMDILLGHARELGLGASLPLEYLPGDPKNPYSAPRPRAAAPRRLAGGAG